MLNHKLKTPNKRLGLMIPAHAAEICKAVPEQKKMINTSRREVVKIIS